MGQLLTLPVTADAYPTARSVFSLLAGLLSQANGKCLAAPVRKASAGACQGSIGPPKVGGQAGKSGNFTSQNQLAGAQKWPLPGKRGADNLLLKNSNSLTVIASLAAQTYLSEKKNKVK